jgi:hypothetical protein
MTGVFQKFSSSSFYVSSNLKYISLQNNSGSGSGKMELLFFACGFLVAKHSTFGKKKFYPDSAKAYPETFIRPRIRHLREVI